MSSVAILHSERPNKLTTAANRADTPWFAANPDRSHYVRRPTTVEHQQARCLHGGFRVGQEWFVASRRSSFGLIERRFLSVSGGTSPDVDERTAKWMFDGALIAGAPPQDDAFRSSDHFDGGHAA